MSTRWDGDGLGSWAARLRTPDGPGELVGTGGCSLRQGLVWSLGYRLARRHWGRGLAQELIAAARGAAAAVRPELPVTAYLLEHNTGSRRAAERAGPHLVWRGPGEGHPDPATVRFVYADRPLRASLLAELAARPWCRVGVPCADRGRGVRNLNPRRNGLTSVPDQDTQDRGARRST